MGQNVALTDEQFHSIARMECAPVAAGLPPSGPGAGHPAEV